MSGELKALKDECGCAVERKYASDFLVRRIFKVDKAPKGFNKIGEGVVEGRKFELFYNKNDSLPLRYKSSECPIAVITLEVLCEEFYKSGGLTKEGALEALKRVKGFTVNGVAKGIAEEVVKIIEESGVHS